MERRLGTILSTKSAEHVQKIVELRGRFACLMKLPVERIDELQTKAVFANYIQGEGRCISRTDFPYKFHYCKGLPKI